MIGGEKEYRFVEGDVWIWENPNPDETQRNGQKNTDRNAERWKYEAWSYLNQASWHTSFQFSFPLSKHTFRIGSLERNRIEVERSISLCFQSIGKIAYRTFTIPMYFRDTKRMMMAFTRNERRRIITWREGSYEFTTCETMFSPVECAILSRVVLSPIVKVRLPFPVSL